jgi:hypothetical protein
MDIFYEELVHIQVDTSVIISVQVYLQLEIEKKNAPIYKLIKVVLHQVFSYKLTMIKCTLNLLL